jgi:hypothetical protein
MITLLVGPQKTRITCHKALLGYFSSFFGATLYEGFVESSKNEVELPEDDEQQARDFVV